MLLKSKALTIDPLRPLTIGSFCLVAFIALYRWGGDSPALNFLTGLFCGLSIVMNLWGMWLYRRRRR
jgi:hypothetical protein